MANEDLERRVDALEKELARYKGFVGGIIFIISGIASVAMLVWELAKGKV